MTIGVRSERGPASKFVQQLLPRLWHERLETQNSYDDSCVDLVLSYLTESNRGTPMIGNRICAIALAASRPSTAKEKAALNVT
jgi:hypothetical protein